MSNTMDRNNTNGKPGSKLSSQDLARYQAELMWMHDKTIREIKEAKGMFSSLLLPLICISLTVVTHRERCARSRIESEAAAGSTIAFTWMETGKHWVDLVDACIVGFIGRAFVSSMLDTCSDRV